MMNFICDSMLGKLAKKLRMLGIDTSYQNKITEEYLIATALNENRIVLTRKKAFIISNKSVPFLSILDNNPNNQLKQTVSHFKITKEMINPFSRCISCNKGLSPLEKDLAEGNVADYVFKTTDTFTTCLCCGKIYWPGTHLQNMKRLITNIFIESDEQQAHTLD